MTPPRILHIEDSDSDAHFFDYALQALESKVEVERIPQWKKLQEYMVSIGTRPASEYPDLIVMDHDVDGTDAVNIIKQLRSNEKLRLIPIIVFSGYDYDQAINEYYHAGVSSYILKPMTIDEMINILQHVVHYWFKVNKGPKHL